MSDFQNSEHHFYRLMEQQDEGTEKHALYRGLWYLARGMHDLQRKLDGLESKVRHVESSVSSIASRVR
jgi:hypothetical protein